MTDLLAFELYLMAHMRGRAAIEAALLSLELAPAHIDRAEKRVAEAMDFFDMKQHPLDVYVDVLGTPLESTPDEACASSEAFAGSQRHRFHLPAWPELDFVLRTHPEGWVFGPELVRRVGARPPAPKAARELQPWSIVESEVVAQFGAFATRAKTLRTSSKKGAPATSSRSPSISRCFRRSKSSPNDVGGAERRCSNNAPSSSPAECGGKGRRAAKAPLLDAAPTAAIGDAPPPEPHRPRATARRVTRRPSQ
jgi:hypothetical protein